MEKIKKHAQIIFLGVLTAGVVIIWYAVFYFEAHQNLIVSFFDIGQGDSIFIESPDGNQILIDGGPSDTVLSKLGHALPFWDRSFDLLILTHPHADHVTGLAEVLRRYRVGKVLESDSAYATPEYSEWHQLLKEKNIPVVIAHAGQEVRAGALHISVLSPFENYALVSLKNPHDANVSTRLEYGKNSVLLMGDGEKKIEYQLLFEAPQLLKADVLKVAHHGSKTSSSQEFLVVVGPKIAVIQVGRKNRYGHPHQEVLDRLASAGAAIFRNDLDGDVVMASDGAHYWIQK